MKHPAAFPAKIIEAIRTALPDDGLRVLDPFCGVGKVASVNPTWVCCGVEIEKEWAAQARERGVLCLTGDARENVGSFLGHVDAIVTSPCYGNRMADLYAPPPEKKHQMRRTYRIALGHDLSPGSAAGLQWGDDYRTLHEQVWRVCVDKLRPGGRFVLNIKNHPRNGVEIGVAEWHLSTLMGLGLYLRSAQFVPATGDQNTATMRARGVKVVDGEWVFTLERGDGGEK